MTGAPQYLLAVYILGHRNGEPIGTGAVAEALDRSPATVTETFQRLDDDGLVEYRPYEGATLTDAGRERAAELHETYVTVSWFFRSVLDLDDSEGQAMRVAGLVSPIVAERLAETLPVETGDGTGTDADDASATTDDERS
ncbi:metal-dependent transcriptional regulator [Halorubrum salinarum]|uniref:Metal-dependent transcriptional regulator n=1 Tax=Halorubrum salinarum TaxID=2739057 RepID=A0A7D4BAS5_9EURY|nr:metal-dependent transcriptional regulator [Halorubrum salinarum]QKG91951.1 metal-dependent transcriptional regulator [Halorubrum salinarum]